MMIAETCNKPLEKGRFRFGGGALFREYGAAPVSMDDAAGEVACGRGAFRTAWMHRGPLSLVPA